jgi:hypothetical protein
MLSFFCCLLGPLRIYAAYRGYCLGPRTFPEDIISSCRRTVYIKLSLRLAVPISSFRTWNGVEIIIFTFEGSIRTEINTYRLDVIFGSLHTQQLHGFDELRNDQRVIQNRSLKTGQIVASVYLPSSYSSLRFLRLTQKSRANKILFLAVRMEVKNTWIRVFHVRLGRYGHQVHVKTGPVWIVCLDLEILSSKKSWDPVNHPCIWHSETSNSAPAILICPFWLV